MKMKNFGTFFSAVEVHEILNFHAHPKSSLLGFCNLRFPFKVPCQIKSIFLLLMYVATLLSSVSHT